MLKQQKTSYLTDRAHNKPDHCKEDDTGRHWIGVLAVGKYDLRTERQRRVWKIDFVRVKDGFELRAITSNGCWRRMVHYYVTSRYERNIS